MSLSIPLEIGPVSGVFDLPRKRTAGGILLAHGAGTRFDHPSLDALAGALAGEGFAVLRFNFLYTEAGRRSPDRQPALLGVWTQLLAWARDRKELRGVPLLAGGRSMGGRMASLAAADPPEGTVFDPAGLVFYAYPLHPAGKKDKLRFEHLPGIDVPMLFLSGTRDTMADPALLDAAMKKLPGATLHRLEDADHGYRVPKRTGRTQQDVIEESARVTREWFEARVSM